MSEYIIKNINENWSSISKVKNDTKFVTVRKRISYEGNKEVEIDYQVMGRHFNSDNFEVEKVDPSEFEDALEKALERLQGHIQKELDEIMNKVRRKELEKLRDKYCYYKLYNRTMQRTSKLMIEEASSSSSSLAPQS